MVEISKPLFAQACQNLDCHVLLHPWHESCIKSMPHTYIHSFIGSAKFYSLIYVAQILMRGKKLKKKEEWLKMGEYYARSAILGGAICATCCTFGCILRRILGNKFYYYSLFLIPSTINGIFIYVEPPSRRGLIINLFTSLMLEYWITTMERAGYLSMTKTKQTIMFMIGSAVLFYLMRLEGDKEERTPLFWLFTPEKVKQKTSEDENPCPHNGPCLRYILKGAATYFGIGSAFTLARVILPKIRSPARAFASVQRKHFKIGLFFGSYIGIYRAVICYLCRKQGADSALYALPAGYLAGLSFLFSPTLGFATASVTAALKLYSTILYEKKILPANIPLAELMYCICQGTLFHARFMHPEIVPSYMFKLTDGVSHGRTALLSDNLQAVAKMALSL
ncbi:transmembrane protein 135-like [Cydia pomonella]|uniref:transmembrane protein 135-like n=1 Tax=Cydia pomonella TaxID=82600 RepID=UPI002ADE0ECE|nr:transmembrane protein 135-like [Cydia pomonella]XP_061705170.1 transmembrane protein 135-like [Cydia pomonella]XP_061705172.1 transmembrane protein 135-like [Cydia pomonella]XP_061705173.1 transmembrane protein 135-like [Cydia pomonella]XP_061705174.1 transmembrane protein 135-like [Cydia pomonella]